MYDENSGEPSLSERTLRGRSLFQGSVVAISATVPRFAAYGGEDAALQELEKFFTAYVSRLLGRAKSSFLQRKRAVEMLDQVTTRLRLRRDRPAPLLGREQELRSLRSLLDGPSRAGVLVVGPAGLDGCEPEDGSWAGAGESRWDGRDRRGNN